MWTKGIVTGLSGGCAPAPSHPRELGPLSRTELSLPGAQTLPRPVCAGESAILSCFSHNQMGGSLTFFQVTRHEGVEQLIDLRVRGSQWSQWPD